MARAGAIKVLVPVCLIGLMVSGCSASTLGEDATVACGWNEPVEPIVAAGDASSEQLVTNAQRAQRRLAAAEQVVDADDRFEALVDALQETADFAEELQDMTKAQIEAIDNERWDFAKYAQAVARDQCEQLQRVVDGE